MHDDVFPLHQLNSSLFLHLLVKNCFRVSSRGRSKAHTYSLQANDSFSKQQWITCLRQAIVQSRDKIAQTSQSQMSPHPDPALYHIADLSLSSDTEMAEHTSRWLSGSSSDGLSIKVYSNFGENKWNCDYRHKEFPYFFLTFFHLWRCL